MAASNRPAQEARGGAPTSSHQAKKKFLVDALLIALRNSEIARVVDIGTLEYFLDSSYSDMVRGSTLHLSVLWSVLVAEPGINPRMVFPPLLAFKSWEQQLGVQVELPQALDALSPEEREAEAARCPVKPGDLERLLAARNIVAPEPPRALAKPRPPAQSPGVRARTVGLVALATLALTIGGGTFLLARPRAPRQLDVSELSSVLALEKGRRSAEAMSAVIADAGFFALSHSERVERVTALFTRVKLMGLSSLFLYDRNGGLCASAVASATGDRVTVTP